MLVIDAIGKFISLKEWQKTLIWKVCEHEREFKRPLPNDSYFKAIALKILRKNGVKFELVYN